MEAGRDRPKESARNFTFDAKEIFGSDEKMDDLPRLTRDIWDDW